MELCITQIWISKYKFTSSSYKHHDAPSPQRARRDEKYITWRYHYIHQDLGHYTLSRWSPLYLAHQGFSQQQKLVLETQAQLYLHLQTHYSTIICSYSQAQPTFCLYISLYSLLNITPDVHHRTCHQRSHTQGNTLHTRLRSTLIRHMNYLIGPPNESNQFSTASIIIVSNLVVHTQVWWLQPQGSLMTLLLYKPTNRSHPRRCTDYYSVQATW